jgi:anti-anti-sigma regulatory factor
MKIIVEQAQGRVPVTVLQPYGDLDASTYRDLIAKGQEVYKAGARYLLIDLNNVSYISSSGLVALHSIVQILRGEELPENGWEAARGVDRERGRGMQRQVKLLNLQPRVDSALETTGFKRFFEIYADRATAIASF